MVFVDEDCKMDPFHLRMDSTPAALDHDPPRCGNAFYRIPGMPCVDCVVAVASVVAAADRRCQQRAYHCCKSFDLGMVLHLSPQNAATPRHGVGLVAGGELEEEPVGAAAKNCLLVAAGIDAGSDGEVVFDAEYYGGSNCYLQSHHRR